MILVFLIVYSSGTLFSWSLVLYGTKDQPVQFINQTNMQPTQETMTTTHGQESVRKLLLFLAHTIIHENSLTYYQLIEDVSSIFQTTILTLSSKKDMKIFFFYFFFSKCFFVCFSNIALIFL